MTDGQIDEWIDKHSEWTEQIGSAVKVSDVRTLLKSLPPPSISAEAKKEIAWDVSVRCSRIPGANFYTAAEMALGSIHSGSVPSR